MQKVPKDKLSPPMRPVPRKKAKRSSEPDVNQLAHYQIKKMTEQAEAIHVKATVEIPPEPKPIKVVVSMPSPTDAEISRVMAALGRRGGKIGGKSRAASMTPERRREIALKAARKRWDSRPVE
jgi:hypothetical protein